MSRDSLVIRVPLMASDAPRFLSLAEFLKRDFPSPEDIAYPILQRRGALMIHGPTGIGKTFFCVNLAVTIATGGQFLNYSVETPRSVVYIDFECQAATLQKRFEGAINSTPGLPSAAFRVLTPDINFPKPMPNLSLAEDREALNDVIDGFEVVFIDNISTSFRGLRENDAESYQEMHDWILWNRAAGRSVVLVQHEGKNASNGFRGSSKQADIMDSIVQLKRPAEPEEQALRFDVLTHKCRHHSKPADFGARMQTFPNRAAEWSVIDLDWCKKESAEQLFKAGMNPQEVARELDVHLSTAYRWKKELQ